MIIAIKDITEHLNVISLSYGENVVIKIVNKIDVAVFKNSLKDYQIIGDLLILL